MKQLRSAVLLGCLVFVLIPTRLHAGAGLTNLFSFDGTNGAQPIMLVQAANGQFYGTTQMGGPQNPSYGGIFSIAADGTFSNLYSFDGVNALYGNYLFAGTDGNFYGTTDGGPGANPPPTVFQLNPDGTMANTNLAGNNLTSAPFGMLQDSDGTLYGTTEGMPAEALTQAGTIYKIDPEGNFTTLVAFDGTNGVQPVSLLLGADNNFYGISQGGGNDFNGFVDNGDGTIFRTDRDGNLTNVFLFGITNGQTPTWLVQGADGDLYGTTAVGGTNGDGTLFRITTNGVLVWSFSFSGTNGYFPAWLTAARDGNFYGVTGWGGNGFNGNAFTGFGTVFKVTPNGSFTTLVQFDGINDTTPGTVIQGTDGNLYGTAGGGAFGQGTIFKVYLPVQHPILTIFQSNGVVCLKWTTVPGQTYQLQTNSQPCSTNWGNFGDPLTATNGDVSVSDTVCSNASVFYRVAVLP
jgi:uncharacterized repeat protein (TIGR03803 family)